MYLYSDRYNHLYPLVLYMANDDFHSHGGTQIAGKSNLKMDDNWGYPHDFGNLYMTVFYMGDIERKT